MVPEPMPWTAGPDSSGPLLVIENAAAWHSYCRWNAERKLFSAVVYGCGNRFVDGVRSLSDIFAALGGPRRVLHFGDLDPQGLLIPQEASNRSQAAGLPAVELHLWSYRQLLKLGEGRGQLWDGEPPSSTHRPHSAIGWANVPNQYANCSPTANALPRNTWAGNFFKAGRERSKQGVKVDSRRSPVAHLIAHQL